MESGDSFDNALGRAMSGDEGGFLVLWDNLQPRLLRYLRVLGCDDVDDVASETWLQALRDMRALHRQRGIRFPRLAVHNWPAPGH